MTAASDSDPGAAGDRTSRDALVRQALDLVDMQARHLARQLGPRVDLDDLRGYAHEAVVEVVDRFDPSRGIPFRTWARLRLRGAIVDGLRRDNTLPRGLASQVRAMFAAQKYSASCEEENRAVAASGSSPAAEDRLTSFLRGLATAMVTGLVAQEGESMSPSAEDPEILAHRRDCRAILVRAIAELGEPTSSLVHRHYFLDEDLQDAAAHLGLSKSWGSRLHARAMVRLAERLGSVAAEL